MATIDTVARAIGGRTKIAALCLAAGLGACAETGAVSYGTITSLYSTDMVGYATRDGNFRVAVLGNPFNVPQAQTNAAVKSALRPPFFVGSVNVRVLDPAAATGDSRLVLTFNAKPGVAPKACELDRVDAAAGRAEIRIDAAFCAGTRLVSRAYLRAWARPRRPRRPTSCVPARRAHRRGIPPCQLQEPPGPAVAAGSGTESRHFYPGLEIPIFGLWAKGTPARCGPERG